MTAVKPITVLNIDDVPYAVNTLSEDIQSLVTTLDGWNQKEADVYDELNILQAAKQTLSAQIVAKIREENTPPVPAEEAPTEEVNSAEGDLAVDATAAD